MSTLPPQVLEGFFPRGHWGIFLKFIQGRAKRYEAKSYSSPSKMPSCAPMVTITVTLLLMRAINRWSFIYM